MVKTTGNADCHLVLRGGIEGPNYQADQIQKAVERLKKSRVSPAIVVDCSHANSAKSPSRQVEVWNNIVQQRRDGNASIIGAMLESFIKPGNQSLEQPDELEYGLSITDACLGWEETGELLKKFR